LIDSMQPLSDQTRRSPLDDNRWIAGLVVAYALVALALLSKLPLWLDEILQVIGTRGASFAQILEWLPGSAGAVPLPYFIQALAMDLAGYSVFSARLPAALFSILSCAALVWLARELRLRWPAVAVALLMALPLQWRYALEGRPYSQAMFFAILATALALRLARAPGILRTALYGLALIAALYTLPLLVLFPVAHLVWGSVCVEKTQRRRVQLQFGIAAAAAVLLLAPWVIWANSRWAGAIAGNQGHFLLHPRLILVLLHELPGGGYAASILLLIAAGAGWASRGIARATKVLLALLVAVPLVGTLAIDAIFDYFFAVRQLIPVLPALALLASEGLRDLYSRRRALGSILLAALLVTCAVGDFRWFQRPREDWQLAASSLKTVSQSPCVLFVPSDTVSIYAFFEPDLPSRDCAKQGLAAPQRSVIVALSPYGPPAEVTSTLERLRNDSRTLLQETTVGGTRILFYGPPNFAIP
jgi:mannosyltransferase